MKHIASLLCGSVPEREQPVAPKTLSPAQPTAYRARLALAELVTSRGRMVSLTTVRLWTREQQAEAYLWARDMGPLPGFLDTAAGDVARALHQAGARVYIGDVIQWSQALRLSALQWARAFAEGREDLPPPEHVYEAAKDLP